MLETCFIHLPLTLIFSDNLTAFDLFVLTLKYSERFPSKSELEAQNVKFSLQAGGAASHPSSGLVVE